MDTILQCKKILCVVMLSTFFAMPLGADSDTKNRPVVIASSHDKLNDESWPMFQNDPMHTGYAESNAPKTSNILWNHDLGYGRAVWGAPIVWVDKVYVGCSYWYGAGKLYCLNASTGDFLWEYAAGDVESSPAVNGGYVYVTSNNALDLGFIRCLNTENGSLVWDFLVSGQISWSSPIVVEDRLFTGFNKNVLCLGASDGGFKWAYPTGGYVYSSPAALDNKVYVGSCDSVVYCLNASNGIPIWTYHCHDEILSSPAIADSCVYVGTANGRVYCLDAITGDSLWRTYIGSYEVAMTSSPAIAYGKVYIGTCDFWTGMVYCLDAQNGTIVWSTETSFSGSSSSPAIADNKVYIGSYRQINCLDAVNGDPIWVLPITANVRSSSAIADGKVFISSSEGQPTQLFCFGVANDLKDLQETNDLPNSFLSEICPNPVTGACIIKYQLPAQNYVKLAVYNKLGQRVRTLVDETKQAGYYTVVWNGCDDSGKQVASGVYFCRLAAGDFTASRKMMLMR